MTDFEAMPSWLPGLRETGVMADGPLARGTVVMQRRKVMGLASVLTLTMLHADPPRELVLDARREAQPAGVWTWRLEEAPGGTRLVAEVAFTLPAFLLPVLPFARGAFRRRLEEDVEALRRRVERG